MAGRSPPEPASVSPGKLSLLKPPLPCQAAGLGGFLTIVCPGQAVLDIPVSEGRVGVIVIGGLNPMAILAETDIKVESRALAAFTEYENLFPYQELDERIDRIM